MRGAFVFNKFLRLVKKMVTVDTGNATYHVIEDLET